VVHDKHRMSLIAIPSFRGTKQISSALARGGTVRVTGQSRWNAVCNRHTLGLSFFAQGHTFPIRPGPWNKDRGAFRIKQQESYFLALNIANGAIEFGQSIVTGQICFWSSSLVKRIIIVVRYPLPLSIIKALPTRCWNCTGKGMNACSPFLYLNWKECHFADVPGFSNRHRFPAVVKAKFRQGFIIVKNAVG